MAWLRVAANCKLWGWIDALFVLLHQLASWNQNCQHFLSNLIKMRCWQFVIFHFWFFPLSVTPFLPSRPLSSPPVPSPRAWGCYSRKMFRFLRCSVSCVDLLAPVRILFPLKDSLVRFLRLACTDQHRRDYRHPVTRTIASWSHRSDLLCVTNSHIRFEYSGWKIGLNYMGFNTHIRYEHISLKMKHS